MLKFMVVFYKRPDLTPEQFRRHLQDVHGPLAKNYPDFADTSRTSRARIPSGRRDGMRDRTLFRRLVNYGSGVGSPEGKASDADLPAFADLPRTTWSTVDEVIVLK
jgi:hypothetical protein